MRRFTKIVYIHTHSPRMFLTFKCSVQSADLGVSLNLFHMSFKKRCHHFYRLCLSPSQKLKEEKLRQKRKCRVTLQPVQGTARGRVPRRRPSTTSSPASRLRWTKPWARLTASYRPEHQPVLRRLPRPRGPTASSTIPPPPPSLPPRFVRGGWVPCPTTSFCGRAPQRASPRWTRARTGTCPPRRRPRSVRRHLGARSRTTREPGRRSSWAVRGGRGSTTRWRRRWTRTDRRLGESGSGRGRSTGRRPLSVATRRGLVVGVGVLAGEGVIGGSGISPLPRVLALWRVVAARMRTTRSMGTGTMAGGGRGGGLRADNRIIMARETSILIK